MKIVMTGSADDGADWQPHIRNKPRRNCIDEDLVEYLIRFRLGT